MNEIWDESGRGVAVHGEGSFSPVSAQHSWNYCLTIMIFIPQIPKI